MPWGIHISFTVHSSLERTVICRVMTNIYNNNEAKVETYHGVSFISEYTYRLCGFMLLEPMQLLRKTKFKASTKLEMELMMQMTVKGYNVLHYLP